MEAHHREHGKRLLSVVAPIFNEEEVIQLTHARIVALLGNLDGFDLEVVYVDDGSKDRTPALLSDIAESDLRVCVVTLSRNFGHQPAVTAGLRQASGDAVAVIDADLQDPVELIPEMLKRWQEGYAVVYGVRRSRQEPLPKVLAYSFFYRLLAWLSEIEFPRDSGDFCLLDRTAVDAINQLPEKNRFVRGLRAWYGGRQIGIPYDRPPRAAGQYAISLYEAFEARFRWHFQLLRRPVALHLLAWIRFVNFRHARTLVLCCASDFCLSHLRAFAC